MPRRADAILMVDDDLELCDLVREYLGKEGFNVTAVHDGASGLRAALDDDYGLVILDVMLPLIDGFGVLRQVRRQSDVPVIMLTARAEERDRVGGFAEGADDYLVKPFAAAELLARIRAVQRRVCPSTAPQPAALEVGDLRLDTRAQQASHGDSSLDLTPTEFAILEVLVRARGRVVSRDELSAVLYQRQATPFERSLDMHVSHLRRKLDAVAGIEIRTVRGLGYTCVIED
jgi:two-component system, OmpR family, response regulator CpxR